MRPPAEAGFHDERRAVHDRIAGVVPALEPDRVPHGAHGRELVHVDDAGRVRHHTGVDVTGAALAVAVLGARLPDHARRTSAAAVDASLAAVLHVVHDADGREIGRDHEIARHGLIRRNGLIREDRQVRQNHEVVRHGLIRCGRLVDDRCLIRRDRLIRRHRLIDHHRLILDDRLIQRRRLIRRDGHVHCRARVDRRSRADRTAHAEDALAALAVVDGDAHFAIDALGAGEPAAVHVALSLVLVLHAVRTIQPGHTHPLVAGARGALVGSDARLAEREVERARLTAVVATDHPREYQDHHQRNRKTSHRSPPFHPVVVPPP